MEMAIHIAFLTMIACVAGSNQDNRFSTSPRIVEMLQTLCPGANICSSNQTSDKHSELFDNVRTTCCTECSCRSPCDDSGHCCFPNRTRQFDEQSSRKRYDCLFPSTVQPPVEKRYLYYSYSMVSEVLKTSSDEINSTSVCGEKKITPWGSLFPVFSPKREEIYKNVACAEADGVDDGKLWDAKVYCKAPTDAIGSDISLFVQGLDSNSFSDVCQVDFIYPGNAEDKRKQICYLDLVDTCHASDFPIPDGVSFSKKEIIDACTSGLLSPYRGTSMYANPFCRICSANVFFVSDNCPLVSEIGTRSMMYGGFSALLDGNFMATITRNPYRRITVYQEACRIQDTNELNKMECRRVECPSGQLHDESGQCRHPNKIWYHPKYQIHIELTAEENLNINDVFHVNSDSVSTILPDLQTPWGNKWMISSIHYRESKESENITKILVTLDNQLSKVYPDHFLNNIKSTVNRDWLLKHNNVSTRLKSSFVRYEDLNKGSVIDFGNYSKNVSIPLYRVVFSTSDEYTYTLSITKLYLCEQIELTEDDFILSHNKRILFNKITKDLMFDAEFELISWKTLDGLRARICINDSGFYRTNKRTLSSGSQTFKTYWSFSFWLLLLLEIINHHFQHS